MPKPYVSMLKNIMKSAIIKLKIKHTIGGKSMRYQRTIITTLILFMVNFFLVPTDSQVLAATMGEEWEYVELEDGTIEITKYNGDVSELVIPAQIDDKNVTSIGDTSFFLCTNLIKVEIPTGVVKIGNNAFAGCSSLTTITIPSSITAIPEGTFENCSNLKGVVIPSSVTSINEFAFYNCSSDMIFYVASGSVGETYAKEHFKTYIFEGDVACEHTFTSEITTASTCIKMGEAKFSCSQCGGYYTEPVALSEHTVVTDPAVVATCTTNGKTEGSHCSVCNYVFVEQEETGSLGHNYTTVIKKATPKKNGSVTMKCSACGEIEKSQSYIIYKPKKILLNDDMSCAYTGKAIKPFYGVVDTKGNEISSYKVSYKNNKKIGTATVTVTFKGKYYSGKMTKKFTICPKTISDRHVADVSMHSAKLNFESVQQATGYQIQYSTKKNFKKAKTVSLKKSKTTSTVIKGLLNNKEHNFEYRSYVIKGLKENTQYYYRIRAYKTVKVNGKSKKIYAAWSPREKFKTVTMPTLNTHPVESEVAGNFELYVLQLDERGYPYFYGYGIGGNDSEKTQVCINEVNRYMFALEKALGTDYGTVCVTWKKVGEHNGIPIVKRYAEPLYYNFFEK